MTHRAVAVPGAFIWRRIHSLTGLWLVLFLFEHLLTNSQAALLLGEHAQGFVRFVNLLHNLPYLAALEIVLIGIPLLIHMALGVLYLFTGRFNSWPALKKSPSLAGYALNQGYTWMRATAVIVGIGLIGHVVQMRFLDYPDVHRQGETSYYFSRISMDDGLYTVARRLGAELYDANRIERQREKLKKREPEQALLETSKGEVVFDSRKEIIATSAQEYEQAQGFLRTLEKKPLIEAQVIAVTNNFGTASLLMMRDIFKRPLYVMLYSIFVLATCFHAGHGFWTFLITWGAVLKQAAQHKVYFIAMFIGIFLALLGLIPAWGTYFLNLRF